MLSSLKKWVQDVAVDLTPPPPPRRPPPSSSSFLSSSTIPGSTHYFYPTIPLNDQHEHQSTNSLSSAVYLSKPISMDSVQSSKADIVSIPPPLVSPSELDLSHLNREEQAHIASVLRRARAVEEQQSTLPFVASPSRLSPPSSISPSISSSSTSTSSFVSEQLEKFDNEIQYEAEKPITPPELILTAIHQCQLCGKKHHDNSALCFQCQEDEAIDREIENNVTFSKPQLNPIKSTSINIEREKDNNQEEVKLDSSIQEYIIPNHREDQSIVSEVSLTNNLTEIDENDFFYDEPSPYALPIVTNPNKIEEQIICSYKIDEDIDDEDDERDHVKELEETIANLSRHFPLSTIQSEQKPSFTVTKNKLNTDSILKMETESPLGNVISFHPPLPPPPPLLSHPLSLSISAPIPINNRRGCLSRSSGVRENLTDLLITATTNTHTSDNQSLQRTLSTRTKRILLMNRHKRNLPNVPTNGNHIQFCRAHSESRFSLPDVSSCLLIPYQNLDDESDLLEIDLNDPIGSMNRTLRSKTESELINNQDLIALKSSLLKSRIKQLRDQTTNTPPIAEFNSSIKSRKKLKKKSTSPSNHTNDQIIPPVIPSPLKLQKSTSTEITYPFPVTKLILNPSRHDLGFRITGGHSIPNCMEVTACLEHIDVHHKNYQILKNTVQEGDEVLEIGGVSLRGKSALFVENLISKIQNEFEIIVRSQLINPSECISMDLNISPRQSMDTSQLSPSHSTNKTVIKSKSTTSICSLNQPKSNSLEIITTEQEHKPSPSKMLVTSTEEPSNLYQSFSHRHRYSLLPNDPGLNGAGTNLSIERQNSNESDESDTLSQYFRSPSSRKSSLITSVTTHGRSQSVTPITGDVINASQRLQNFLKSNGKRKSRGSTSGERKSSLALISLNFLKKKTKSVDFTSQRNLIMNQLRENDYVGDIEIQIGHDSEREQLVVRIIRAKNLLPKDTNGFSDPFVKIYLLPGRDQENKRRIKHVSKSLNPHWDHTVIYGHIHREELQYKRLEFTVWDYDRFKANDFLGQVTIDLKNPNVIDDKSHWYHLQSLRSREEITNRGSSPRLFNMTLTDSPASSSSILNKKSVTIQSRPTQNK